MAFNVRSSVDPCGKLGDISAASLAKRRLRRWVFLLGRRDLPTDGVRDYCVYLAEALASRGIQVELKQVSWAEKGWVGGLAGLWKMARDWKDHWVVLQYTPLAWSRRGFPLGAILAIALLRSRGARTAVVFHDWTGYSGPRLLDHIRWTIQRSAMRAVARLAERSVLPAPPERAAWLRRVKTRASFIAIGANLPAPPSTEPRNRHDVVADGTRRTPTVAVFGVTENGPGVREAQAIASAVRDVAPRFGGIRLIVFGRGSEQSRALFERDLEGSAVELSLLGLLSAQDIARELSGADALLFVRGKVQGHRGSAIAGIACGTPVVGYGDPEEAFPLSVAGLVLVAPGDVSALTEALRRVLADDTFRQSLRERSAQAQARYFAWERIAQQFDETLR